MHKFQHQKLIVVVDVNFQTIHQTLHGRPGWRFQRTPPSSTRSQNTVSYTHDMKKAKQKPFFTFLEKNDPLRSLALAQNICQSTSWISEEDLRYGLTFNTHLQNYVNIQTSYHWSCKGFLLIIYSANVLLNAYQTKQTTF